MANIVTNLKNQFRLPLAFSIAKLRSLFTRHPLPPGRLLDLDRAERSERELLLKLADLHGPIFKAQMIDRLLICVIGVSRGRRLLKEGGTALQPITMELRDLFPEGFMRQMEGDVHRTYRAALVAGITGFDFDDCREDLRTIVATGLNGYEQLEISPQRAPAAYKAALSDMTSSMLLRIFFGAEPGSPQSDRLMNLYHRLGPHGLVWYITDRQKEVYVEIVEELRNLATRPSSQAFENCLLGALSRDGPVDDTLLGNLIYMVEMGRYDMAGLFRWISMYAAENPAWIKRIVEAKSSDPKQSARLAQAFVHETLRLNQSERMMRNVKCDLVFEGHTIPKGSLLRLCLWEAHKDETQFPKPFNFDPSRFMSSDGIADGFSPFGLDQHHCPFSSMSVEIATAFLRMLVCRYQLDPIGLGSAFRGVFHWEPPRKFSVMIHSREGQ